MLDPTALAPVTTRLRALLRRGTSGLDDEAVAAARSAGLELAGVLVSELIEGELSRPAADGTAIRAAHLAHELALTRAVPTLVRVLERLPAIHPLHRAALIAVVRLGNASVDALLAAFDRCRTPQARARIGEALARTTVQDDRIRAALARMLEDDPVNGARLLADHGAWRAVADLGRAMDRLTRVPAGDCDCAICSSEQLRVIAVAIRELGGSLTEEQRARFDEVLERADAMWTPFEDPDDDLDGPAVPRVPAARSPRPGRNDPCHCGSGKKYKRCHLEADRMNERH